MKNKRTIRTTAFLVALMILYSSVGLSLNIHYCSDSHRSTCNFAGTDFRCVHCHGHDHNHEHESDHCATLHFAKKCCCQDLNRTFRLIPNAETKLAKHALPAETVCFVLRGSDISLENVRSVNTIRHRHREVPPLFAGHERVLFLSSLKLDGMC